MSVRTQVATALYENDYAPLPFPTLTDAPQEFQGVYYSRADAVLALLLDDQPCPNGCTRGRVQREMHDYRTDIKYDPCPNPACVNGVVPSAAVWRNDLEPKVEHSKHDEWMAGLRADQGEKE